MKRLKHYYQLIWKSTQAFKPKIVEYIVATTTQRDAKLQEAVRTNEWPFRVNVLFWEDIRQYVAGDQELLKRYYPEWQAGSTSMNRALEMFFSSSPDDYIDEDSGLVCQYKHDTKLQVLLERGKNFKGPFGEKWASGFMDKQATAFPVTVLYGSAKILVLWFVEVDGGRYFIPFPASADDLRISKYEYTAAQIVNKQSLYNNLDSALERVGIIVDGSIPAPGI